MDSSPVTVCVGGLFALSLTPPPASWKVWACTPPIIWRRRGFSWIVLFSSHVVAAFLPLHSPAGLSSNFEQAPNQRIRYGFFLFCWEPVSGHLAKIDNTPKEWYAGIPVVAIPHPPGERSCSPPKLKESIEMPAVGVQNVLAEGALGPNLVFDRSKSVYV